MLLRTLFFLSTFLGLAAPLAAQILPGFTLSKQWRMERIGEHHWKLIGAVEIEKDDMRFYAEEMEVHTDTNRIEGRGNVVFTSGGHRIAADRMEFDTATRVGTFYNAAGTASLGDRVDRSMFGTQEPDAYFYGELLEKLGPKKYRITKGGFTTCLQPTPRWEVTSSAVTINLDDYAILRNSVLKVKGVPLFYMPVFYYPIQEDDRATGFLIPTYGNSTFRGQSLSNAFFWAINRSHDATFFHDWYTKTGQGYGGEYRYLLTGGEGTVRTYWLKEHESSFTNPDGTEFTQPARRSYEIRANMRQRLPANLNLRSNVDYFSNVTTQQLYHQNIYDASQGNRSYGANLTGAWGGYSLNATYNVNEVFYGDTDSTLYGGTPRVGFNVAPQRLFGAPVYVSLGSEYAQLRRESQSSSSFSDQGLTRMDLSPTVRVPFTKWQFLTLQSSATWHATRYSESLVDGRQLEEPLVRRYFDLRTDVIGPVFVKIWDTPSNGYASKFKHVIEPYANFQRITAIENSDDIVQLESYDYTIGNVTRVQYGLTNRFLAKRREQGKEIAREFLTVGVHQSYYTDPNASTIDSSYSTSFRGRPPSSFSPISIDARAALTEQLDAAFRMEYDPIIGSIQSVATNGTYGFRDNVQASAGWSQRQLLGFLERDNFLNANTSVRSPGNVVGGAYSFNYDLARQSFLQQRIVAYYNAQCCGLAFEYQTFNFPQFSSRFPIAQDRRFNFSFTLAGIGTFSNMFGALGGAPRR